MTQQAVKCVMCNRKSRHGLLLHAACEARLLHRRNGESYHRQMVRALQMKRRLGQHNANIDDDWMRRRTGEQLRTLYLWLFGPNDVPEFFKPYLTNQPAEAA